MGINYSDVGQVTPHTACTAWSLASESVFALCVPVWETAAIRLYIEISGYEPQIDH